jgi:chitodextrinase
MDPDAKVQVATLGTALYFTTNTGNSAFIGKDGAYEADSLKTTLASYTRVYGLASTPDFGGQPNTIDTTTLDNTKAETSVLGLQPAAEVSYEINMMTFADTPEGVQHNLRAVKVMADAEPKVKAHWLVVKASGVIIEYDATTSIAYTADAQQDIEKFSIFHDVKSDIAVSLPAETPAIDGE